MLVSTDRTSGRGGRLGARRVAPVAILAALGIVALGPAPATAEAEVLKVRADKRNGRVLMFRPKVEPGAVRSAKLRHGKRARRVGLRKVRAGLGRGKVRVRVPRRTLRGGAGRRSARRWVLVLRVSSPPPAAAPEMLVSSERLATLPTSGAAWAYMKQQADLALAEMDLTGSPSSASPWLPNYNGSGSVRRPGVQTLAAALVFARTGQGEYRDHVIAANRYLIGSESSASTDGTAAGDRTLATARNISAYVLAAAIVGMPPTVKGSRAGQQGTTWHRWLASLRTTRIGAPANCNSLAECSNRRGHNWGAFATAARIAIDVYLGDDADLASVVNRYKRFLGESTTGSQWQPSSAFDPTYACAPAGTEWTAVNPEACGAGKDGMIVEDISRSAGSFDSYDQTGIGYTMESYQALLLSAIMLEQRGYDPFAWGDQALLRVMQWLEREDLEQGNGSSVELHQSWIANHFYGADFETVPAGMGRSLGFTDWLFAG